MTVYCFQSWISVFPLGETVGKYLVIRWTGLMLHKQKKSRINEENEWRLQSARTSKTSLNMFSPLNDQCISIKCISNSLFFFKRWFDEFNILLCVTITLHLCPQKRVQLEMISTLKNRLDIFLIFFSTQYLTSSSRHNARKYIQF